MTETMIKLAALTIVCLVWSGAGYVATMMVIDWISGQRDRTKTRDSRRPGES